MGLTARSFSMYEGGKLKLVGSGLEFIDFASAKELVCTGDNGANLGEEKLSAAGGGVAIDRLKGVLPAAVFFSI